MKSVVLIFYAFALAGFSSLSCAQPVPLGPVIQIGSLSVYCIDALGNKVMNYTDSTSQIAVATKLNGGPAIVLDPSILGSAPWAFNVLTYAHECAHHYLGHVVTPSFFPNQKHELAADCMAAKTTRNYGWLPPQQFLIAMQVLYHFQADASHPPGPYRVNNANACYANIP